MARNDGITAGVDASRAAGISSSTHLSRGRAVFANVPDSGCVSRKANAATAAKPANAAPDVEPVPFLPFLPA
jgi:hypothetical protein